jgi:methylated-DNA-[protein]-cysteine S-methyltransferase
LVNNHSTFSKRCYYLLLKIPKGKVTTYHKIAHALDTKAYQAVVSAMKKKPTPIIVPCHRVVNSNGKLGQFTLGKKKKIELLKSEGVTVSDDKIDSFKENLFYFETIE